MTRYQHAKRAKFLRGLAAALLLFTVFVGALSLAGHITAEQPVTYSARRRPPSLSSSALGRLEQS